MARIVATGLRQVVYHTVPSRHPFAFVRGLVQGLRRVRRLVARRKVVLGWRRVDDERIGQLLAVCDDQLRQTRANRVSR